MSFKLSIMICNYNQGWGLERALNSIPKRNDIQIVIVDDCSTDNSNTIINNYMQNNPIFNYKYIKNNANYGLGVSRNIAQTFIEGDYFTVLDSDDWFLTENLNIIIDNYTNQDYDFIYFSTEKNNKSIMTFNESTYKIYSGHNKLIRTQFIKDNNIQWHNLRRGSDLDFDRQWWYLNHKIIFTDFLVKHWNRPNEKFDNLSVCGAKNMIMMRIKINEFLEKDSHDAKIIKDILRNRLNKEFIKSYNPQFEEVEYNYEIIK